ncbi:hypothetical protein GQ600_23873 [Phytophthora cactorum]|nr:hypothetical protein GQ600_23873 [Phytophthora cactorum]
MGYGNTSPDAVTTSESENDSSPFSKEDVESMLLDSFDGVLEDASFLPKKEPKLNDKKPIKKKRKKTPGASTRLQQRKKAEILALRALSEQLEGRLEQLKRGDDGSPRRLQSGVINQRLRAVLTEQMKVSKALREVFRDQASLGVSASFGCSNSMIAWGSLTQIIFFVQNLNAIFGEPPGPVAHHSVANNSSAMIGELKRWSRALPRFCRVFQPKGSSSISSSLQVKQEQLEARCLSHQTTFLPCSVREASVMFWRDS